MITSDEFLWVEKYRPHKIEDTILPEEMKTIFKQFVQQEKIPNLLLSGPPGCGKTTVAKAMLDEIGADYMMINGSLNGNIDTLRNEIQRYASAVSLTGNRKYVILDEADYLNANSTQPALRNFIEEYSKNCGFILTCNFVNRIIEPLRSRCSTIEFKIGKKELPQLATQFLKRVNFILTSEEIPFEKAVVAEVIKKHYPDWRKVIQELQKYSATGKIDTGILVNFSESSIKELMKNLKEKNFTQARKWVAENVDSDSVIFRTIYDTASDYIQKNSIPALVLILAKYQYQEAFVADKELNVIACLTEIMVECEFV